MKARISARAALALATASAIAITGVIVAPVHAATKTTVVIQEPSAMTSINPLVANQNLVTNDDVVYFTGFGFYYVNNLKQLTPNTKFGSWKVVSNKTNNFAVAYTVNPGQVWSDGTPITGEDLLLSHVTASNAYTKSAGLGDPDVSTGTPDFNSGSYSGVYGKHIVGMPALSADKMTVTFSYDAKIPDWEQFAPGVFPVHTLELLAAGKTTLGSAAENLAAKAKFLSDFTSKNTASLKAMGKVWSNSYNITNINSSTNPLLLVGNGDFKISSAVDNQSVTLTLDPTTNGKSGPKTTAIEKVIFRFDISDAAAPQALANKELDLYQGQVTPDAVAQLKTIKGVTLTGGTQATYEQVSLRVAADPSQTDTYKGPFTNPLVRKAFLLAFPRQDIIDKLIKPVVPEAVVLNSRFVMPDQGSAYASQISGNGSAIFTAGTQATRTAEALRIMQSVYGKDVVSKPITILMDYKNSARRIDEFALYQAEEAKAGFKVTGAPNAKWSPELVLTKYDAAVFGWGAGLPVQKGDCGQIYSTIGNNHFGWKDPKIDTICDQLQASALPAATVSAKWIAAERALHADYYTLGMFQWPQLTVVNSELSGVKPSAVIPNLVWNYWDWHF